MKNSESKEMYLETILELHQKGARVRSIDVATELGFSRPSVSVAVKSLVSEGLVSIDQSGNLLLTDNGRKIAEGVYERHCVLTKLFTSIGVEPTSAEENACRIEHIITDDVFEAIKKKMK